MAKMSKIFKIILATAVIFIIFILFIISMAIASSSYVEFAGVIASQSQNGEIPNIEDFGQLQPGIVKGKRTTYPSSDNPYFFSTKYNRFVNTPYGPPALRNNCTWYAYGRFAEILGRNPVGLPTGNASQWYPNCTGFKKGSTPKVGAVMCWKYIGDPYGHVAIVEEIKPNGDVVTSNSGWRSNRFWMQTWTASSGYQGGRMVLQGFIYQP